MKAIYLLGQSIFFLFTSRITRERFEFGRTRASTYGYPVFEMGENGGDIPRKFFSFHCLENESNALKDSNTEGTENYPDLPRRSESKFVVIEETETSPSKSLAVLHVAKGKEAMVGATEDTNKESVIVGGEEFLLSSSGEGSEALEKFLRDKLDSFSGQVLEKIVVVDPTVVLELLEEKLVDRGSTGSNVVAVDGEMPRSRSDDILRSKLQKKKIGSLSKRPFCDVDVGAAATTLSSFEIN